MSRVIDHLAELTGSRDRDVLDVTLVGALRDLLQTEEIAIYRAVGEEGAQVWLTRARLLRGESTAQADPLWTDFAKLPALDLHPERAACLQRQQAFDVAGPPARAYFPMATEVQTVSVLELTTAQALDAEQLRMVSSILRIYRNFQGLLDYSERDTLTGLLNRKTFDESFLRLSAPGPQEPHETKSLEMRRLAPSGRLWLGVIDIDQFKRVNDNFGHLIGDEVLLLLSRLMRTTFRFHDHLYRFGGEEFVVLMRCIDVETATSVLQRLRRNVEVYRFPQVEHITISVGFTALRNGDSPSGAFERADRALFHVKQSGRNGVAEFGQLVELGHLDERARDSKVELF